MLTEIEGNLLDIEEGVICHQVNCQGVMGGGIALQIKNKWPSVYRVYKNFCTDYPVKDLLGYSATVYSGIDGDYSHRVANIFGQEFYGTEKRQTNYGAVAHAFDMLSGQKYSWEKVYVPYLMGCGLAGGDWGIYSEIIEFYIPDAIIVRLPEVK